MQIQDWGRIDYQDAWNKQRELVQRRARGLSEDLIVFCEHPEVITLGRAAQRDILSKGPESVFTESYSRDAVPTFDVERGGMATYHGPGQLVVYPIVKLDLASQGSEFFKGVHGLIRSLEQIVVSYLRTEHALDAGVVESKTGVWIEGKRKIASIGVGARQWVSFHGLALNFKTDSKGWSWIHPCGFESQVMTDIFRETQKPITYAQVKNGLIQHFENFLGEPLRLL